MFIYLLGRKGQQIYRSLTVKNAKVEDNDERTLETVIEAFKEYWKPTKILTIDRVEYLRKEQSENESFEDYLLNLNLSSKDCEWNNITGNDMIKLQIIKGIHDGKTREILLREPDLTLTQWCRAAEQSEIQSQKIEKYDKLNVSNDTYEKDNTVTGSDKNEMWLHLLSEKPRERNKKLSSLWPGMFKCKRKNHFATSKICMGKRKEQDVNKCFHIGKETIHKVQANLRLNIKPIQMLDSGATVNVIPVTFVKDNKMEYLLKKGKKFDISVYGGKKKRLELKELWG